MVPATAVRVDGLHHALGRLSGKKGRVVKIQRFIFDWYSFGTIQMEVFAVRCTYQSTFRYGIAMTTITLSNGDVFAVSDDFQGIEYIPPVKQERHCFEHGNNENTIYPVDSSLRTVGDWVESLDINDDNLLGD